MREEAREGEEGREVMQVNDGRHMLQQQTLPGPFSPAQDHFIYLLYWDIRSGGPTRRTKLPCDSPSHGPRFAIYAQPLFLRLRINFSNKYS